MTVKIFTVAHVPDELQNAWLQHLRDFDTAHPGCHFEVGIDAPDEPMADLLDRIRVEPELSFTQIFGRAKWAKP
jgi:hypothetical protein